MLNLYTAGPDIFLTDGAAIARRKVAICARHGIRGRTPLDADIDLASADAARRIYENNRATMLGCDAIIANLTPFRGPAADDGTAFELGFFAALRRPAFAYSNACGLLAERTRAFLTHTPDPMPLAVEDFGLPANLMLPHGALSCGGLPIFTPEDGVDRGFDSLEVFEHLIGAIAARCAPVARLRLAAEAALGEAAAATAFLHAPRAETGGLSPAETVIVEPGAEGRLIALIGRTAGKTS